MSIRTERVAGVIKETLAQPISDIGHELRAGLVTVTTVRLTADLGIAKVYISVFGSKELSQEKVVEKIAERAPELRSLVGRSVRLRTTPALQFYLDNTLDEMERIQRLIDESNKRVG